MRFLTVCAAVLLSCCAGCAAPPAEFAETHAVAIRDSVATFLRDFRQLSAAAQWDSLANLYSDAPTFRFFESGQVRYRSANAIREALKGVPAGTRIETTYRDTDIVALAPGLASVGTLFETSFIDATGGGFQFAGALTLVLRHEPAGWRIVAGHSSVPVPRGP